MSELQNVNVGIVSGVERFGTYVPIRGRRRTGSRFEYLSETGTNEDSETVLRYLVFLFMILCRLRTTRCSNRLKVVVTFSRILQRMSGPCRTLRLRRHHPDS